MLIFFGVQNPEEILYKNIIYTLAHLTRIMSLHYPVKRKSSFICNV